MNIGQTHNNITGNDKTSTGPKYPEVTVTRDKDGNTTVNVQENMRNPFTPVGSGIQSDVNISINPVATQANINGTVSGAPSFEANLSVEGGPNQNVPLQSAPDGSTDITRSINFGIGLQETKPINVTVPLQQPEKKKDGQ